SLLYTMSTNCTGLFDKTSVPEVDGIYIVILPILIVLTNGIIFITITHFAGKDLSRRHTKADLEMLKDNISDDNNASGRSVKAKLLKNGQSKSKKGGQSAVSRKKGVKKGDQAKGFAFDVPEKEDVGTLVAPVQP
ncbi:hypothetical protein PMAYCL1PPCAC_17616, partial [Pristionchus mayeri]